MPFYERQDIDALFAGPVTGTAELDLRGLDPRPALERLFEEIRRCRTAGVDSLVVRVERASPTSGETLFLPVGRALLRARRDGRLSGVDIGIEAEATVYRASFG